MVSDKLDMGEEVDISQACTPGIKFPGDTQVPGNGIGLVHLQWTVDELYGCAVGEEGENVICIKVECLISAGEVCLCACPYGVIVWNKAWMQVWYRKGVGSKVGWINFQHPGPVGGPIPIVLVVPPNKVGLAPAMGGRYQH